MVSGSAWSQGLGGARGREKGGVPERPPQPPPSALRPDGLMYQKFRNQFLSFSMYQSECLRGPCFA